MTMSSNRRWVLLATVSAGLLLIALDNSILYTALPTLVTDLGASSSQSLWIINAYPVVMAGLLLGAGTLGDRVGHRKMFLIGLVIFGLASILAAFSPTPEVLIAARAILAVGAAAMMPATLALIRITFEDERERNVAVAIWGTIAVVGGALGPIVSGLLLLSFPWGAVFLINVPVVILAVIATMILAPKNDPDRSKSWDLISSVFALVTLVGLVIAIKEVARQPSPLVIISVVASVAGGWAFVHRQGRLEHPLLDFKIFRNPAFTAGVFAAGVAMFAVAGIQLITTQRFQLIEGFTPLEAGLLVAAVAAGTLPTAILGGSILWKVGLLPLIAGGFALSVPGAVLVLFNFDSNFGMLIAGLVLTGAGLGAAMSVASTAIIGNVPVSRAGMASSVEEVSYEFGGLTAVAVLGSMLSAIYTATINVPAGIPGTAAESLDSALALAHDRGEAGSELFSAASQAFDGAYFTVMIVIVAVLAVGAILTGFLLRHNGPATAQTDAVVSH